MLRHEVPLDVLVDEVFQVLLTAAFVVGDFALGQHVALEALKVGGAVLDVFADAMIPTVVTIIHCLLKAPVGADGGGDLQAAGKGVHAADVRVEEIDRLVALAAYFGVEVHAARRDAAMLEDGEHALGGEINIGWELVGVPAEEQITGVGVDGAEEALAAGVVQLVLHGVAGQRGVVGLNVELHVIFQTVGADKV